MSMARRDYILRLIEQFGELLAKIMGLRKTGKLDEAEKLASETADGIFGSLRKMIDQVDPSSAAALLGSSEKLSVYAALTAEDAEIAAARGDPRRARARRRRALELFLEASRMGALDGPSRATVELLRQTVDVERLDDRYRELLASLPAPTT